LVEAEYPKQLSEMRQLFEKFQFQLDEMAHQLPENVSSVILDNCQVNGAVPVSSLQIFKLFEEYNAKVLADVRADRALNVPAVLIDANSNNSSSNINSDQNSVYFWAGPDGIIRAHTVPEGFQFRSFPVKTMWDLWYFGDSNAKITAYRRVIINY